MSLVDQFESTFRAAARDVLDYRRVEIRRISVITDLEEAEAEAFCDQLKAFLKILDGIETWIVTTAGDFTTAESLLELVESQQADLICTYRNLLTEAWLFPHSLGVHLDVLLQRTTVPVLVVPHPRADYHADHALATTRRVMAITDHLANEHELVNHAARLTQADGTLFLAHFEDEAVFERYIDAISKIPTIDTEGARAELSQQLLKQPRHYIESCRDQLRDAGLSLTVEPVVAFGDHLSQFREHIENHQIDLLVMNAKDEDQLAMHGLAYPLAVELRQIPLLIL